MGDGRSLGACKGAFMPDGGTGERKVERAPLVRGGLPVLGHALEFGIEVGCRVFGYNSDHVRRSAVVRLVTHRFRHLSTRERRPLSVPAPLTVAFRMKVLHLEAEWAQRLRIARIRNC